MVGITIPLNIKVPYDNLFSNYNIFTNLQIYQSISDSNGRTIFSST